MNLFFDTRLTEAVYACEDKLRKIAYWLTINHDERKIRRFTENYKSYNSEQVNIMIEEAMEHYIGAGDLRMRLEEYVKKFDLKLDLSEMIDTEMIKEVAKHKSAIIKKLDKRNIH